jgi:hypothetical protein
LRVRLLKRIWDLVFVPNMSDLGRSDTPDTVDKKLRIWQGAKGQDRLETVIHECLHGAAWHIDEEFVSEFSRDLGIILWKLGYRGPDDLPPEGN